ncbi:MAG TPA: hypothetical protein VMU30_11645 [Bacteroidota bacterium]|nr:hypothetical protein [Bacteroidota bacterium]
MHSFAKTYSVVGKIWNDVDSIETIRTEITYYQVGQNSIKGVFYGDEEVSEKLFRILRNNNYHFCGIWSSSQAAYNITFRFDHIFFNHYGSVSHETDKLCEFECFDLEIETNYSTPDHEEQIKKLIIHYTIPQRNELVVPHAPQEYKECHPDYKDWLEYETPLGIMKLQTSMHSCEMEMDSKQGTFLLAETGLSFEILVDGKDADDIIKQSKQIVEDYLDLTSFILRCETKYYKLSIDYYGSKSNHPIKNFLRLIKRPLVKQTRRYVLLNYSEIDNYLKKWMPVFINHRHKKYIHEALSMFLTGIQSEYPEVCLIVLHTVIEVIIYCLKKEKLLPAKNSNKKRISANEYLLRIISMYNIDIHDIYPSVNPKKSFPFITYRNNIMHGKREKSDYMITSILLYNELLRQQTLLERLIIHWLGYDARKIEYLNWQGIKPYKCN